MLVDADDSGAAKRRSLQSTFGDTKIIVTLYHQMLFDYFYLAPVAKPQ